MWTIIITSRNYTCVKWMNISSDLDPSGTACHLNKVHLVKTPTYLFGLTIVKEQEKCATLLELDLEAFHYLGECSTNSATRPLIIWIVTNPELWHDVVLKCYKDKISWRGQSTSLPKGWRVSCFHRYKTSI